MEQLPLDFHPHPKQRSAAEEEYVYVDFTSSRINPRSGKPYRWCHTTRRGDAAANVPRLLEAWARDGDRVTAQIRGEECA